MIKRKIIKNPILQQPNQGIPEIIKSAVEVAE
jgi:hypothetical protein